MTLETFRMCSTRARTPGSTGLCTTATGAGFGVSTIGGGAVSIIVSEREMLVGAASWLLIGFPHCGQNIACWRTDTPQNVQRRAISISGSDIPLILETKCGASR